MNLTLCLYPDRSGAVVPLQIPPSGGGGAAARNAVGARSGQSHLPESAAGGPPEPAHRPRLRGLAGGVGARPLPVASGVDRDPGHG
jgi:hypothetical protein